MNIYKLNSAGEVESMITGDDATLMLNLPDGLFTIIEPDDYTEQIFDFSQQKWVVKS